MRRIEGERRRTTGGQAAELRGIQAMATPVREDETQDGTHTALRHRVSP
jgi:hypothetical protein